MSVSTPVWVQCLALAILIDRDVHVCRELEVILQPCCQSRQADQGEHNLVENIVHDLCG